MLTINELLYSRGLPKNAKVKFVRHADNREPVVDNYKFDVEKFLYWQGEQSKPIFHECEFLISFLGMDGKRSRFIGVFKVEGFILKENNRFQYNLTEVQGFEDIKDRVIVDWVSLPRSWHQWTANVEAKPIIEVLPSETFYAKAFSDYLDFILDFSELKSIIKNRDSFKEWHLMLAAVKGIYLILDKFTGNKYIGSAYRENGILGRWEKYANTNGHGNNKQLKALLAADNNYARHFQFTILMTLPKTMTATEVIKREVLFKQKLGTKSFGLNSN
jgi:hypothetical protein